MTKTGSNAELLCTALLDVFVKCVNLREYWKLQNEETLNVGLFLFPLMLLTFIELSFQSIL